MEEVTQIDGTMSCWMLKVSLLVLAWLAERRLATRPIGCDVTQALKVVIDRLNEEARNLERGNGRSLELMRCAGMTPGDLFYNQIHHRCLLILIQQELAKQQAFEDRLAQRSSSSHPTNTRGPPKSMRPKSQPPRKKGCQLEVQT
jgi:hypothetical protein